MAEQSLKTLSAEYIEQLARDITVRFEILSSDGRPGAASGFVVSQTEDTSYIVTNRQVVENIIVAESRVRYPETQESAAFFVAIYESDRADIAVVQTGLHLQQAPCISLRQHLVACESLFYFGFSGGTPYFNIGAYNSRIYNRAEGDNEGAEYCDLCYVHGAPGASGSAVFDAHGEVL
jgi:hypothetical protein